MSKSSSFKGYLPATTFVMAKKAKPGAVSSEAISASVAGPSLLTAQPAASTQVSHSVQSPLNTAAIIFIESKPTLSGASTELLYKMIDAMGVKRDHAFITNIGASDVSALVGKIVVALGDEAAQAILKSKDSLSSLRAKVHFIPSGPKVIATYHPAHLIQNPSAKKDAWDDLKLAMRELSLLR